MIPWNSWKESWQVKDNFLSRHRATVRGFFKYFEIMVNWTMQQGKMERIYRPVTDKEFAIHKLFEERIRVLGVAAEAGDKEAKIWLEAHKDMEIQIKTILK